MLREIRAAIVLIVALTIIVRIVLVPLTVRQIHSMQSM